VAWPDPQRISQTNKGDEMSELNKYLGDGVYASFDGYHVWLAVNDHENRVVALEPDVVDALFHYVDWLKAEAENE
jgi:hypothetical protein